jgi:tetratricopeptide (TPR) repeat protein
MAIRDISCRKVLLLSLALSLGTPQMAVLAETAAPATATEQPVAAQATAPEAQPPAQAAEQPAAEEKVSKHTEKQKSEQKGRKGRHEDEGYYGSMQHGKKDQFSDIQRRHQDEGYYSEIKPYVPPPPEAAPVPPPQAPVIEQKPELVVPPVRPDASGRKFDDDTGATGSITATRHAKQAKELLANGQFELAKRHFKESLAIVENQPELYPGYWECCTKTNDWSEALRILDKMFEVQPAKKAEFAWAYGQALYQLRRYDKAKVALKDAVKYGKNVDDIHLTLLKIAQQEHNNNDIVAEYNALLKLKPSDYKTQLEFANLLELQGRHAEALSHYKSASNLQPSDGGLAARVAYMLMYYNKDYKGAIAFYSKALAADPGNAQKYQDSIKYCQYQMQPQKKLEQN